MHMAEVMERTAVPEASEFVRGAVARMQAAQLFFSQKEWNALESYEGPVISGDPQGCVPEDLEAADE
jgi:hypothetical protein